MRIVIDLQAAQSESRFRGIGRYSLSLARAMVREGAYRGHDLYVVLNGKFPGTVEPLRAAFFGLIPQDRIVIFSCPAQTEGAGSENDWRASASELLREEFLAALKPDVVHVSSLFEGWGDESNVGIESGLQRLPTAVTLYDLIPYVMSDLYLADPSYRRFYLRKIDALKKADLLLAISDHSRNEAIELLQIPADRVINISAAIGSDFEPADMDDEAAQGLLAKYGIDRPFVLYVPGGFDPRKNFDRLIDAFASLPSDLRAGLQLVLASKVPAGMSEALYAKAKSVGLEQRHLILTGYVPDEELIAIYGLCRLSVFPSLHEGFGLPALEAMACGAPVIASKTTSLPEVVGYHDALFDPLSVSDMARVMRHALTEDDFLKALRRHCREHVKKFNWERSASLALDGLEAAFKSKVEPLLPVAGSVLDGRYNAIIARMEKATNNTPQALDLALVRGCLDMNKQVINRVTGGRQLLVDISELVNRDLKSGIQRVVRSILLQLLRNPPSNYRVEAVYTPDGHGLLYAKSFVARFLGQTGEGVQDVPVTVGAGDVFVGLDLTAHLFPAFSETLHHLREAGVHIHYVVYDLTPLMNTRWHTTGMTQAFTHWIDGLADSAHSLVCISEAVATDVRRWFDEQRHDLAKIPRISYFHLGADIDNSRPTFGIPEDASKVLGALQGRPSFLMVGTIEPRKGYAQVIDAFDVLWRKGGEANLVIVGRVGWSMEALVDRLRSHPMLNKCLFWLEGISDEYLEMVYKASSALLAASEYEGFGLPLIEAAQHKLPIVARDIPAFREVAGEHAFWFTAADGAALTGALETWLELKKQNAAPKSEAMPWLTWEQSTEQLLRQIEEHTNLHVD
ncbi:glycosyltransferase family 1 protein [Ramlibacter sp. 2FC]|uniref:glycosyltransferase family 4 protein n=1 Tax=Ramlibacter sp. 2FC TaxID=2502188 RepID=UPI0010F9CD7A|nr:glycosyltransferase family 1 protein [Ramlibacter sp. 2FC]